MGNDPAGELAEGKQAISDSFTIRQAALQRKVPYATTVAWAKAMVQAMQCLDIDVINRLQDLHQELVT